MRLDWLIEDSFNALEALFWMALAIFLIVRSRPTIPQRRVLRISALLLVFFAVSDVVEIRTGAWWSPWWLLLWKTLCVLGLLGCAWHLGRSDRRPREPKK